MSEALELPVFRHNSSTYRSSLSTQYSVLSTQYSVLITHHSSLSTITHDSLLITHYLLNFIWSEAEIVRVVAAVQFQVRSLPGW
jgi:hypothetical protein